MQSFAIQNVQVVDLETGQVEDMPPSKGILLNAAVARKGTKTEMSDALVPAEFSATKAWVLRPAKQQPLSIADLITRAAAIPAGYKTAQGIISTADAVARMPEAQIVEALRHGSALISVPADRAEQIAKVVKHASQSALGRHLAISLAGGVLIVAVVKAVNPKTSWPIALLIGAVGVIATLGVLYFAEREGWIVEPTDQPVNTKELAPTEARD